MIPEFLDCPNVLGIGEIGLNKNTRNESIIFEEHLQLAIEHNQQILIHTPHLEDKFQGTRMILDMLANHSEAPSGRVVCLGSPLTGSRSASFLSRQDWAEPILGLSLSKGVVDEPASIWASAVCAARDIGVIAGNSSIGLAQFVAEFEEDNDGTVAVSETQLPGARDHLLMPVSHNGMLLSASVLDQAAAFLKRGEFLRETS